MYDALITETDYTVEILTVDSFDPYAVEYLEYVFDDGVKEFERHLESHPSENSDLTRPLDETRAIHARLGEQVYAIAHYDD